MGFIRQMIRTMTGIRVARHIDVIMRRIRIALGFAIAVFVMSFLSLIIIAVYFLTHLIQGR
jgi:hypothetical protein